MNSSINPSPAAPSTTRTRLHASFWKHPHCVPFSEDVVPSSLFLKHTHYLVIDVETQRSAQEVGGWSFVDRLGVSVACAYDSQTDRFLSFREAELPSLFQLCQERLVVGYNIRGFDLLVLQPYGLNPTGLDVFDILYDLETLTRQQYLKLEAVARGTLGTGKSGDGLQALEWWKQGEIQKIIDYCLQDVKITRDIFQYGRQEGHVFIQRSQESTDRGLKVPVLWN